MSNRYEEIDKFLKFVAEKRKDMNGIYRELAVWNIPESERVFQSSDMYVYDNAGMDYMSATSDENWFKKMGFFNTFLIYNIGDYTITDYFQKNGDNKFLRFYNPEVTTDNELNQTEPIKMYMSLGKDESLYFLYSLMKFCEDNRILHNSKLSDSIRTDDIVLRVYSLNDAEKIAEYIKNCGVKLNNPNPFCLTEGEIGYAMDSGESYNKYVAETIERYISQINDINEVGYESFKEYVDSLEIDDVKLLSLKLALDSSKTIQDFYKAWNKTINPNEHEANTDEGLEKQREYEKRKKQERLIKKDSQSILIERKKAMERRTKLKQKLELMREINASVRESIFNGELGINGDFGSIIQNLYVVSDTEEEDKARKKREEENERERKSMIKSRLQKSELVAYMNSLAKIGGDSDFSKSVQKFRQGYDLDD